MRRLAILSLFLLCLASSSQSQPAVKRDPAALSLLKLSYATMGGADLDSIRDTTATVQVITLSEHGQRIESRGTLKTLGASLFRSDLETPDGPTMLTINGDGAWSKEATGAAERIPRRSVSAAGISHIPLLSILGEWSDAGISLEYLGGEDLAGSKVHRIRMQRYREQQDDGLGQFEPPCELYIDSASLLPVKLVYPLHPPANLDQAEQAEVSYGDYRRIAGILVPFKLTYRIRDGLLGEYQVLSFLVNQQLQESEFKVD